MVRFTKAAGSDVCEIQKNEAVSETAPGKGTQTVPESGTHAGRAYFARLSCGVRYHFTGHDRLTGSHSFTGWPAHNLQSINLKLRHS
jgi:hypothetical protein